MRVKSEAKRQAILDISKTAFIELGYTNTSMSEIAARVGGSKATLYNYFSSKEEIFAAVMESSATEQVADAFEKLDTSKDLKTVLNEFAFHYLSSILQNEIMSIWKMAVNEADRSDIGRQFYENGPKKGWMFLGQYLQTKMSQGLLRSGNSWLCAMHLQGLIEAEFFQPVSLNAIPHPDAETLRKSVAESIDIFLRAYQP